MNAFFRWLFLRGYRWTGSWPTYKGGLPGYTVVIQDTGHKGAHTFHFAGKEWSARQYVREKVVYKRDGSTPNAQ